MFGYVGDTIGEGCPRRRCPVSWSPNLLVLATLMATSACQTPAAAPTTAGARPTPAEEVFNGCPGEGRGPDPQLNLLKNRVDQGIWQPTAVAGLLQLTRPPGIANKRMTAWASADRMQVEPNNGNPVQAEGYLLEVREQEPESTNCDAPDLASRDFHGWLSAQPTDDRAIRSLIVEFTPRIRAKHSTWTLRALDLVVREKTRVRISGWTMLDPDHPDEVGKSRGTLWEIHPVMKIETAEPTGAWKEL